MCPQQTMRQAMEGAYPQAAGRHAQHLFDAPAHFGGGLVGEGDGENRVGRYAMGANQPGDTMYQHAGLAAAGAGEDEGVPGRHGHRLALCVVQRIQKLVHIHGEMPSSCGTGMAGL
jgi:hypothetical protein